MVVLICNSMENKNIEQFFMCLLALHLSLLLGTVCKSYACSLIRLFVLCCCCSVAKSCPTLWEHMNCSMPGFPVLHYLPKLAQTHVHWVNHPTISSSVIPFSSLPSIFSSIRIFSSKSALCIRWPKYWSFNTLATFPMNIQGWFPLGLTGLTLVVQKTLKSLLPPAPQLQSINSLVLSLLQGPTLTSLHDYWVFLLKCSLRVLDTSLLSDLCMLSVQSCHKRCHSKGFLLL